MNLHTTLSILLAVALPLWLVVEQLLKWKVLSSEKPSHSAADAVVTTAGLERTSSVGSTNNSTGPALQRRAA